MTTEKPARPRKTAARKATPPPPAPEAAEELPEAAAADQNHDQAADVAEGQLVPEPAPVLAGTFAIYEDGRGGYVLVADTPQNGTVRKHIPSAVVKMATGGILGRRLGTLFGG